MKKKLKASECLAMQNE